MKNVLVKYFSPEEVMGMSLKEAIALEGEQAVKEYCLRAMVFPSEGLALLAYAECRAEWSTLVSEEEAESFIDTAWKFLKDPCGLSQAWLETHFV